MQRNVEAAAVQVMGEGVLIIDSLYRRIERMSESTEALHAEIKKLKQKLKDRGVGDGDE